VIILDDLFRVLTGRLSDDELVMVKESEEAAELQALQAEIQREDELFGQHAAQGSK
jgi:hypothetical protein